MTRAAAEAFYYLRDGLEAWAYKLSRDPSIEHLTEDNEWLDDEHKIGYDFKSIDGWAEMGDACDEFLRSIGASIPSKEPRISAVKG